MFLQVLSERTNTLTCLYFIHTHINPNTVGKETKYHAHELHSQALTAVYTLRLAICIIRSLAQNTENAFI